MHFPQVIWGAVALHGQLRREIAYRWLSVACTKQFRQILPTDYDKNEEKKLKHTSSISIFPSLRSFWADEITLLSFCDCRWGSIWVWDEVDSKDCLWFWISNFKKNKIHYYHYCIILNNVGTNPVLMQCWAFDNLLHSFRTRDQLHRLRWDYREFAMTQKLLWNLGEIA